MKRLFATLLTTTALALGGLASAAQAQSPQVIQPATHHQHQGGTVITEGCADTCKECVRVCVPQTKIVYCSSCRDYCVTQCNPFGRLFGGHSCDCDTGNCGEVRTKRVLIKRAVDDCPTTRCEVQQRPSCAAGMMIPSGQPPVIVTPGESIPPPMQPVVPGKE